MNDSPGRLERAFLRREPFLIAAVVTIGIVLRLPDLFGWWPNPDEGIYYGVVTTDSFGAAWEEALATSHPPLYFLLLRAVGWLSTDFVALRSLAFLSGCAAIYVFVLLGRELGGDGLRGRISGLVAGALLAVAPRAVVLSQVIRPYMLLLVLLGASLLLLLRYLRAPSTRLLLAHGACSLLAALLHYGSVFGLAALGTLVLADGLRRGFGRPAWRRVLAVQAVPALVLLGLYLTHLRVIAAGPLGDHALEGWLALYMVEAPVDVWFGFVGVHSMLVGDIWAAPAALTTLAGAIYLLATQRARLVLFLAGIAFALAVAGAILQLYPFGPTRHDAWLLVFLVPLLSTAAGAVVVAGRRTLIRAAPLLAIVLVGGRLLVPVLDPEARPREISEHVLREAGVEAMAGVLDPMAAPDVVLMSSETYELLTPLYVGPRQSLESSRDGELRHFRWGRRDVVVIPSRDFAARPDQIRQPNHLYTAARRAEAEFGLSMPGGGDPVLVLSGGWRSQGMLDLVELARRAGPLGTTEAVPGLVAIFLDLEAFGHALGDPPV